MKTQSFFSQRPLFLLAVCFGIGIAICRFWIGFALWLPLAGVLFSLLALLAGHQYNWLKALALCLLAVFLGMLRAGPPLHQPLPKPGTYQVTARVEGLARPTDKQDRVQAVLADARLTDELGQSHALPRLYWTYPYHVDTTLPYDGQQLSFIGNVYLPRGQENPFGFDFRLYLLQNGIPMGVSGAKELVFLDEHRADHQDIWLRLRLALATRLDQVFAGDSGMPKALLLGVRDGLSEQVSQDFRDAGIAHILAVSGLHVGLMMGVLLALLGKASLSPRVILPLAGILLMAYARLLDFSPSVVRASTLVLLLLSGRVLWRRSDPLTSLALAFVIVLLINPLDMFNIGFQLSFLAVLGIFTLGDKLRHMADNKGWYLAAPTWVQKSVQAYIITISASALTLVPLVNTFHRFSLVGLLINPLACLLIGILMPVYAALLLLSALSLPLAAFLAIPVNWFSGLYQMGANLFASLPMASPTLSHIPLVPALLLYLLLFLSSRYCALGKAYKRWSALVLSLAIMLSLLPRPQPVTYTQLSQGNADSAIITDGQLAFVVDAGTHGGDLISLVLSRGLRIHKLILTHLHMDHMGGLQQLLDAKLAIGEILLPAGAYHSTASEDCLALLETAGNQGIPIREVAAGDYLVSPRINAQVLWPYREAFAQGQDPNVNSLVVYWDLDGISLLTTGDIGPAYAPYAYQMAQVMKLPHHGAIQDNQPGLLATVNPQVALVSAAQQPQGRYQEAKAQLAAMDVQTLVTGENGAVSLVIRQGTLQVISHGKGW